MKLSTAALFALATLVAATLNQTATPSAAPAPQRPPMPEMMDSPLPESIAIKDVHATKENILLLFQDLETGNEGVAKLSFRQAANMGLIQMR